MPKPACIMLDLLENVDYFGSVICSVVVIPLVDLMKIEGRWQPRAERHFSRNDFSIVSRTKRGWGRIRFNSIFYYVKGCCEPIKKKRNSKKPFRLALVQPKTYIQRHALKVNQIRRVLIINHDFRQLRFCR